LAGALATGRTEYNIEENKALTANKRCNFNGLPGAEPNGTEANRKSDQTPSAR
jgi:hypothetical protein